MIHPDEARFWTAVFAVLLILTAADMAPFPAGAAGPDRPATAAGAYGLSGKIGAALAQTPTGTGPGRIDPRAPRGFAGIPGAPRIDYAAAFLWAVWVGWIFSTVGAFGGIMAGVGHLTIFGLGAYAAAFKGTNPTLNALLTDSIRASNQVLVAAAALISTWNFLRMRRIVVPLGLALGLGSVTGAVLIPWLTAGRVHLREYVGYFGLAVLVIGGFLFYGTTARGRRRSAKAREAAEAFRRSARAGTEAEAASGVRLERFSPTRVEFRFSGVPFGFNPLLAAAGGLVIAGLSAFLGIGGGFLYVPFMTGVVGLPMFIVAGTSALAVLLSMVVSLFTYVVVKGTFLSWSLVGAETAGVIAGAMIGPRTQKYIPDLWLKRIFVVLALYVGLRYFSKGFFGQSWLPPY
ncbi:sulfite exporter TauE/SafE family protein [Dissulfurirhabdus thermomarina]|uniref:Probable membrane transporter protein n=1 Tax=Dissulfurirhabdus thermomarina TaxID=1765737 RepID=A0A6N9TPL2_DISTH|nr:sulfite exporter TauE/SafE family protein [Dissulfurirhabdus thermomarina]NDY43212.1 sulfite exporter TauE/SafE family protein [Dissulfurirhabdus thermomarina]NMX23930.1 sulfite exporter TauE/SafE family protein [Dissulfurirhabdus thermomarina]